MDQVESICDRVGIMHDGSLIAVDTIEALRTSSITPSTITLSVATVPDGLVDELTSLNDVVAAFVEDESVITEAETTTSDEKGLVDIRPSYWL